MSRYFYIITSSNSTRIDEGSPYRLASAQIHAESMDKALQLTIEREGILLETRCSSDGRKFSQFTRKDKRVGIYISPVAEEVPNSYTIKLSVSGYRM